METNFSKQDITNLTNLLNEYNIDDVKDILINMISVPDYEPPVSNQDQLDTLNKIILIFGDNIVNVIDIIDNYIKKRILKYTMKAKEHIVKHGTELYHKLSPKIQRHVKHFTNKLKGHSHTFKQVADKLKGHSHTFKQIADKINKHKFKGGNTDIEQNTKNENAANDVIDALNDMKKDHNQENGKKKLKIIFKRLKSDDDKNQVAQIVEEKLGNKITNDETDKKINEQEIQDIEEIVNEKNKEEIQDVNKEEIQDANEEEIQDANKEENQEIQDANKEENQEIQDVNKEEIQDVDKEENQEDKEENQEDKDEKLKKIIKDQVNEIVGHKDEDSDFPIIDKLSEDSETKHDRFTNIIYFTNKNILPDGTKNDNTNTNTNKTITVSKGYKHMFDNKKQIPDEANISLHY